jgi:hypothetical protein
MSGFAEPIRTSNDRRGRGLLVAFAAVVALGAAFVFARDAGSAGALHAAGSRAGLTAQATVVARGSAAGADLSVPADELAFVRSNAAGDTTAVWSERAGGQVAIRSASEPAGGTWSPVETIVTARAATVARSTEPVPMDLAVAPDGSAHVLWARVQKDDRAPHVLQVASRAAPGRWDEQRIAAAKGKQYVGPAAALAATADGTVLVLWGRTTAPPSDDPPAKLAAGSVWVTERSLAGAWRAPRKLGRADPVNPAPQLAVNRSGSAAALWSVPGGRNDEQIPLAYATRSAGGGWTAGDPASRLSGPGYGGVQPPLLDEAGRLHVLTESYGNYGVAGLSHRIVGPQTSVAKADAVPDPTADQTQKGYLGSGYVFSTGAALAADGQLVVVSGHQAPDVENGAFGIGAIWSAARTDGGQWKVSALDALAETTAAMNVDVSTDTAGSVVATWTADVGIPPACSSVVYGSVRGADGAWSPRAVVADAGAGKGPSFDAPINSGPCYPVQAHRTGGADPAYWWLTDGHLVVTHGAAQAADPTAAAPTVEQVTTTWQQVRRAGGLQLRCATDFAGYCSASIVAAVEQTPGPGLATGGGASQADYEARALRCFSLRGTSRIGTRGADQVATLPVGAECRRGWVPPTISFDVLIATDAAGHDPAQVHQRVTISR